MNRPDHESAKHPVRKNFFCILITSAVFFVLSLTFVFLSKEYTKWTNMKNWEEVMKNEGKRPDLVLAFQAGINQRLYEKAAREFGEKHHCTVKVLRVPKEMLMDTLHGAMEAGGDVPDLVELLEGTMGDFTDCPIDKVAFVDLTDRLKSEGYLDPDKMVQSTYALWSSRGHIFAIPKTVHPVALCYRVDLIEKLGIDVTELKTWDDFVRVGQQITGRWEENDEALGIYKGTARFMIDFNDYSIYPLMILLNQRGFDFFDAEGNRAFDRPEAAELIAWFVHQTRGPNRISFPAGDGQNFYQAMKQGRNLFFLTPDWRTMEYTFDLGFEKDTTWRPSFFQGKLALMPMPVWADENGDRLPGTYGTGTWGGCGLAITKNSKNQMLAWEFAKYLYLEASDEEFGDRFRETNIVPAARNAWKTPEFHAPSPFFKEMVRDSRGELVVRPVSIGKFYASMADDTPPRHTSPYLVEAESQFLNVYFDARDFYESRLQEAGNNPSQETLKKIDDEMLDLIREQLKRKPISLRQLLLSD